MFSNPRRVFLLLAALGIAIGLAWLVLFRYGLGRYRPLEAAREGTGPAAQLSEPDRERFLRGWFVEITRVEAFPDPLRPAYREANGTRFTMADPGEPFQATDVIYDASLPRRRLVFAGQQDRRFLIHYEQGGIARSYRLDFLEVGGDNRARVVWEGYCNRAAGNVRELAGMLESRQCGSLAELRERAIRSFPSDSSRH